MLASLPMYDWPEVRDATDAWWAGVAGHLRAEGLAGAPAALERERDRYEQWRSGDLLLSQTCGYPLTHALEGRLEVVAVPAYAVEGCEGPSYSSALIVRAKDRIGSLAQLRGGRAAFNAPDSLSGHLALKCAVAPISRNGRFFGACVETGSHVASLEAVRKGKADVAAVDCVALALARRHRPALLRGLKVVGRGPNAPALPYVTAAGRARPEIHRLRRALAAAAADPALSAAREALFIQGLEFIGTEAYARVLELEAQCHACGYTELA